MSKKNELLKKLLGERRRHHVTAYVTEEGEWNQHEPNNGLARMFVVMLLVHVVVIGAIILYDFVGEDAPVESLPVTHPMTASSGELPPLSKTASNVPAPANAGDPQTYEVRSGDSIPIIASRLQVDANELIKLNHLDEGVNIEPHTVLRVPDHKVAAATTPPVAVPLPTPDLAAASESTTDAVPLPDSAAPAGALQVMSTEPPVPSTESAASASEPAVPAPVEAAKVVATTPPAPAAPPAKEESTVPATEARKTAPDQTVASAPPSVKETPAPKKADTASRGATHTVAKGDTLYSLSRKYGVPVNDLMRVNNIKNATQIQIGRKLTIPSR